MTKDILHVKETILLVRVPRHDDTMLASDQSQRIALLGFIFSRASAC